MFTKINNSLVSRFVLIFVLIMGMLWSQPANPVLAATAWYVATSGSDSNDCATTSTPCATINGALGKAADGDTIYVSEGLYQGSAAIVGITKSITILGGWNSGFSAQTGFSILDGTGAPANTTLIHIYTSTTMERLIIRNSAGGINTACTPAISVTLRQISITGMTTWGAIRSCATLLLVNSTVTNNEDMAIVNSTGTMIIQNSTITNNGETGGQSTAGGINSTAGGSVSIQNSIITGNTGYGGIPQDCNGDITSGGHNIIGNTTGCYITPQANDMIGIDPKLGPLLPNGYFPLSSNSPAIDSAASCPSIDQRGLSRPQGSTCDIGAYEYATPGNVTKLVILSGNGQRTAPNFAFPQPLIIATLDSQDNLVPNVNVTFTAPGSGASGFFANTGTNTSTVASNINGIATASTFIASSQSGNYTVTAFASGAGSIDVCTQRMSGGER